jgi:hypothetical protein
MTTTTHGGLLWRGFRWFFCPSLQKKVVYVFIVRSTRYKRLANVEYECGAVN